MEDLPPELQQYVPTRTLGQGRYGTATLVTEKSTGDPFVVKEILLAGMDEEEIYASRREVKLLQVLSHPNVLQYHTHAQHNDSLYIVTEYADSGTLYDHIRQNKPTKGFFPEEEVMQHFTQLCLGVDHLHRQHVLHRDIKTDNIFLTSRGILKLGDFGLSTMLCSSTEFAKTLCGTPNYFAPELCQLEPYNNKADVWALGCVLYEYLTGRMAFAGPTVGYITTKIKGGNVLPIPHCYPSDINKLCMKMLTSDPADRPDVTAVLRSRPVQRHLPRCIEFLKTQANNLSQSSFQTECSTLASDMQTLLDESTTCAFDGQESTASSSLDDSLMSTTGFTVTSFPEPVSARSIVELPQGATSTHSTTPYEALMQQVSTIRLRTITPTTTNYSDDDEQSDREDDFSIPQRFGDSSPPTGASAFAL